MADDAAGCFGAVIGIVLLGWAPLHFSGKSILYGRTETTGASPYNSKLVTCHYFNSTGTESILRTFDFASSREAFYCPRIKDIGQ